jgi:hypothetical protein
MIEDLQEMDIEEELDESEGNPNHPSVRDSLAYDIARVR